MEERDALIFGVCSTLEQQTGINAWIFRALFVLTFGYGGGFVYALLALIL